MDHNSTITSLIVDDIVTLVGHVAWPIAIAIVVVLFRKQLRDFLHNITNVKVGDITIALEHLTEKVNSVEASTKNLSIDLYKVTGDALKARDEIWGYVADILKSDHISEITKHEMAVEFNKYHLSRLNMNVSEVKTMLHFLGYFYAEEPGGYNEEITRDFIKSVFDFQVAQQLDCSDGIIGPLSMAKLKRKIAEKRIAQDENTVDL